MAKKAAAVKRDKNWLLDEIHKAANETARWPTWMQDSQLWHDQLSVSRPVGHHESKARSTKPNTRDRQSSRATLPRGRASRSGGAAAA